MSERELIPLLQELGAPRVAVVGDFMLDRYVWGDAGRVSPEAWGEMMRTCEQAMGVFPRSLYAGVDLLVQRNLEASAVLEVNAYGDLLPRVLFEGMDTYEAEIRAAVASWEETS